MAGVSFLDVKNSLTLFRRIIIKRGFHQCVKSDMSKSNRVCFASFGLVFS